MPLHFFGGGLSLMNIYQNFELNTIGNVAKSYSEIFNATRVYNSNELLSKLAHNKVNHGTNDLHLKSLCINELMGI